MGIETRCSLAVKRFSGSRYVGRSEAILGGTRIRGVQMRPKIVETLWSLKCRGSRPYRYWTKPAFIEYFRVKPRPYEAIKSWTIVFTEDTLEYHLCHFRFNFYIKIIVLTPPPTPPSAFASEPHICPPTGKLPMLSSSCHRHPRAAHGPTIGRSEILLLLHVRRRKVRGPRNLY